MDSKKVQIPDLDFSKKYDARHSVHYFEKHEKNFMRRLSNWRELKIAQKALQYIGNSRTLLDMPCGTGRFWEILTTDSVESIFASDYSIDMLKNGLKLRQEELSKQVRPFQSSAFAIPLRDNAVECIFCMRLLHHISDIKDRKIFFQEMARVSSDYVIISLWVDGNIKAMQRASLEKRRAKRRYQNRLCHPRKIIEEEFFEAGLSIVKHIDFFKFFSMWRIYVLKKC